MFITSLYLIMNKQDNVCEQSVQQSGTHTNHDLTVENYYGHHIETIEDEEDIEYFAEVLADELQADYSGDLNEEDRAKFHYDLMFNSMTIAWEKMMEEEG